MFFYYESVPNPLNKLHGYINFIVNQVWGVAPSAGVFRLELFDNNPDLKEIMTAYFYSDKKYADFFYGNVEKIYNHFAKLERKQIKIIKRSHQMNNRIETICKNSNLSYSVKYSDLDFIPKQLVQDLEVFFKGLYDHIDNGVIKQRLGDMASHYESFVEINNKGKCPFCGISDLKNKYHSKREAYDHYLPKGLYPFNSINFLNLCPACHECNSTYKSVHNPALTPKDPKGATRRRKAFYPFSSSNHDIELTINVLSKDIDKLDDKDLEVLLSATNLNEEINTWDDVYGIKERFVGKLLGGDAKAWVVAVEDEWKWAVESGGAIGNTPSSYLATLRMHCRKSPFTDANFLKLAFLDGCERAGLFDS